MKNLGVVIFTYDRPDHLNELLNTYYKNKISTHLPTTVFMDAAKDTSAAKKQLEIAKIVRKYNQIHGNLELIQREDNLGSKVNIMTGITESFEKFNKLIILEDDLILSENFLEFLSVSLEYFEGSEYVYHISGCSLIENTPTLDPYFTQYMNCWGWGTWKDKWEKLCVNPNSRQYDMTKDEIHKFNFNGSHDFYRQIYENRKGIISTWAILWYASIFKNEGLCLSPGFSLVDNRGNDGSGERHGKVMPIPFVGQQPSMQFPSEIEENKKAREHLIKYFKSQKNVASELVKNIVYLFPLRFQKPSIRFLMSVRCRIDRVREKVRWH